MRKILLALVAILTIAVSPALASAAAPTASAPRTEMILLFHENSPELLYGTTTVYIDSAGVIHIGTTLPSFVLSSAPNDPFGTTVVEVHALTIALAKANVEVSVSIPANAATTGFENITLRAVLGSDWFAWKTGDPYVLTNQGKIFLTSSQMATLGGDPGYAMTAFFPLRMVATLLGGKVIWSPDDGGIVLVELPTPSTTTLPFYVP